MVHSKSASDATPTPRDVFAALQETVLRLDMAAQADLFAAGGILEWPFAPESMPRRIAGKQEIRRVLTTLGERARLTGSRPKEYMSLLLHETTDPEVIVAEFTLRAESSDGTSHQLPYIQVLRARGGEIVEFRDYWNPQALLSHLEAPASSSNLGSTVSPPVGKE